MDKKSIARVIVFVLVWVNTFLATHHYKTIPVVDDVTVAGWLAFIYSAYVEGKHIYKWVKDNWFTNQPAPVSQVSQPLPAPTPTAVDVTLPDATQQNVQQ